MAVERKWGQWSCQVVPTGMTVFQVPGNDIVITSVSLGPELRGDARSTLIIHHVNTQAESNGDNFKTQGAAVACLTPGKVESAVVNLVLTRGQQIALEVQGDNDVHLFGYYLSYYKPLPTSVGAVQAQSSTRVRSQPRLSHGSSASSASVRLLNIPFPSSQATSSKRKAEGDAFYTDDEEDTGHDVRESVKEGKRARRI
ncbi:hypothetical protein B0H10DRAFT_2038804 [Mycena sp. CBHHK59/15]|nr:hypothetical protein B0H10DRAFT_2038804 [Mycena sp. CBHHK59/15]